MTTTDLPDSHVKVVTYIIPKVGSRWMSDRDEVLTVTRVGGGVRYTIDESGYGTAAYSFFLSRFKPILEDDDGDD